MFQAAGGWPLCYCVTSHPSPPHTQPSKVCHSSLTSFCPLRREGKKKGGGGTHTRAHTRARTHTCTRTCSHRQPWLCFFPLAYLVEWPWKTKQVLSTFDFSAFKLILSAQLLKQLSSPAVSNFRLGTFTGCQVLSLHCESLAPFLSKRYSNNLYFFLKGTCIALFLYQTLFIIY